MSEEIYCRLCAMKIEKYVKIYGEEGEKLNLATKIIQCLQIWLYPEDVLPKTICTDCCSKINLFFEFFQTCSQSQISLMSIYKEKDEDDNVSQVIEIGEMSNGNVNLDHNYEDDIICVKEDSNEYIDLGSPEKASKRKLRTPIKHSSPEEQTQQLETEQDNEQIDQTDPSVVEKKDRKCKRKSTLSLLGGDEDDLYDPDNMSDAEDETSYSGKGLDGYIWKCITCAQELSTLAELRRHHAEVHNQAPVFACVYCTKSYSRYRSFARHVKTHSDPKKFVCKVCDKRFSQKTVLQAHAAVHSDERPHACPQCDKTFKQFSSLYLHSKCHLPEQIRQKFQCSFCPKEFSTKHTLETHTKMHTGERNFVCDICGKRFVAKGSLDYHILTHNDAKPHCCKAPNCGKGFKTARLLAKHETVHSGIKPHQCDVCGKQFRERGALREHNRIHTGAMPYACDFCGKLFRFKGILTVHRRLHTGERPYSCTECRRDFTNWANYNKHLKRRHRGGGGGRLSLSPSAPQHEMPPPAPSASYDTSDTDYKLVDEEVYRLPNYVPSMSYYMPPLQHTILPTRTQ